MPSGDIQAMRITTRSYLSTHQLWTASHFAAVAEKIEDEHRGRSAFDVRHRAYVSASILASVAFLESAINELFQDVADGHSSYTDGLDERTKATFSVYWRESDGYAEVLSKYQLALSFAGRAALDPGAEPFQSAKLLVKLRNLLVHFRPKTGEAGSPGGLELQMSNRFEGNRLMDGSGNPFWPDRCLGAGCAKWAQVSARSLADEVFARLGLQPNYQRIEWS